MKLLKVLGAVATLAVVLFVLIVNFSAVESRFECTGEISSNGETQPATVFLKQERYRWWVGLWSDSYGSIWLEFPNKTVEYFGYVSKAGDLLQLWDSDKRLKGNFSTLSKSLAVDIPVQGVFTGICKETGQ